MATKKKTASGAKRRQATNQRATDELTSVRYGEVALHRGSGGETRQQAGEGEVLTTAQGVPISDDQNWLAAGERGPQLLEDFVAREKIFHFDHERIPERVVHARGMGAKGYFESYDNLGDLTCASLFAAKGKKCEVFARFSTVAGSAGSPDLARDVRGFAVKFYTDTGNWDLVGNNIPVFFVQDAMKFPDLIHAVKPEPDRGFPQAQSAHDNFWDFISLMPETTHTAMWAMSDRAIPRGLQFMEGFGVHTFRFVTEADKSTYVKFHWKPLLGMQSVTWDEAVKINGADPDFHRRAMWNGIKAGNFPAWELGIQTFDDDFADRFAFDVLDATKLIPEEDVPVRPIGKMVLNKTVDNFFAETEQVAFCTQNVVRGIDFTNDPLLQGRNFSYLDTQLKRLGSPNFTHLPVNAPRCPFANFQQDGHMAMHARAGRANYEPNSWGKQGGPREDAASGYRSVAASASGDSRRVRAQSFADHFSQARQFYHSQTDVEQQHIIDAFTFELSKVKTAAIRERVVANLRNVDKDLAGAIAEALGLPALPRASKPSQAPRDDLQPSPALSIQRNPPPTLAGRCVGALVEDGVDAEALNALRRACKVSKLELKLIAPTIMGISDSGGTGLSIAETFDGGPSVLFDAVAVLLNADSVTSHIGKPPVHQFIADAHAHCKYVGYLSGVEPLIEASVPGWDADVPGYLPLSSKGKTAKAYTGALADLRCWARQHD